MNELNILVVFIEHVLNQQSIMSGKLEKNNRSWKEPQRNSSN
jgi:hypothetical protein